jgi:hypothetical protein
MQLKFVSYKIAPMNINETLWNDEADLLITCMKANVDIKIVPGESRSQGSQKRAPLGAKIASHVTPPLPAVAYHRSPASTLASPLLTLAYLSLP